LNEVSVQNVKKNTCALVSLVRHQTFSVGFCSQNTKLRAESMNSIFIS